MIMFFSSGKKNLVSALFLILLLVPVGANEPMVSIYRDFDDGLFGRSIYRGVLLSVKLDSFKRYKSLNVGNMDGSGSGLTAYLISKTRAKELVESRGDGVAVLDQENRLFEYKKDGINIIFALEHAPKDLYDEIKRTYTNRLQASGKAERVIRKVSDSYESGYVIRIYRAENVYRPQYATIDYEDILISAALVGDAFQPLWGIHDGNDLTEPGS